MMVGSDLYEGLVCIRVFHPIYFSYLWLLCNFPLGRCEEYIKRG